MLQAMLKNKLFVADIVGTVAPTGSFVKGGASYLPDAVKTGIEAFIAVVIIAAIVGIIYNGLMFITAGGDSNKVNTAIKGIIYSLVGLGVALAAGLVVQFVVNVMLSK